MSDLIFTTTGVNGVVHNDKFNWDNITGFTLSTFGYTSDSGNDVKYLQGLDSAHVNPIGLSTMYSMWGKSPSDLMGKYYYLSSSATGTYSSIRFVRPDWGIIPYMNVGNFFTHWEYGGALDDTGVTMYFRSIINSTTGKYYIQRSTDKSTWYDLQQGCGIWFAICGPGGGGASGSDNAGIFGGGGGGGGGGGASAWGYIDLSRQDIYIEVYLGVGGAGGSGEHVSGSDGNNSVIKLYLNNVLQNTLTLPGGKGGSPSNGSGGAGGTHSFDSGVIGTYIKIYNSYDGKTGGSGGTSGNNGGSFSTSTKLTCNILSDSNIPYEAVSNSRGIGGKYGGISSWKWKGGGGGATLLSSSNGSNGCGGIGGYAKDNSGGGYGNGGKGGNGTLWICLNYI